MKKTILITVIAIVLVLSIAGTCFALYKSAATDKVVNITASGGENCNLTIGTSTSLDFAGISPSNRTKTSDITLSTSNNNIVDGVHGLFKVAIAGNIAEYITLTVNEIASVGAAEVGSANADALTNAGADIALSTVPKYFRVTMYLNDAGVTAFATIAEQTATVTVSWTVNQSTIFAYDANAYYIVGSVGGVTAWYPTSESIVLNDQPTEGNQAMKTSVSLTQGDVFKVVKNYKATPSWYGGKTNNTGHVSVSVDNGDITVNTTGVYDIYVNNDGRVWVAVHANE